MDSNGGNVGRSKDAYCGYGVSTPSCSDTPVFDDPTWSPDGQRLAYIRKPYGTGFAFQIWVGESQLTGKGWNFQPDWQPKPQS